MEPPFLCSRPESRLSPLKLQVEMRVPRVSTEGLPSASRVRLQLVFFKVLPLKREWREAVLEAIRARSEDGARQAMQVLLDTAAEDARQALVKARPAAGVS